MLEISPAISKINAMPALPILDPLHAGLGSA